MVRTVVLARVSVVPIQMTGDRILLCGGHGNLVSSNSIFERYAVQARSSTHSDIDLYDRPAVERPLAVSKGHTEPKGRGALKGRVDGVVVSRLVARRNPQRPQR